MNKITKIFLLLTLIILGGETVHAAPNIVSQNLTGSGSFTQGSNITFSADTRNSGTSMTTSDSYGLKRVLAIDNQGGYPGNIAYDVVRYGNYAYIAYSTTDFIEIYNVSDPENPTLAGSFNPVGTWNGNVSELEVSGSHLFVGGRNMNSSDTVAVYSLSNPTNPARVSGFDTDVYNGTSDASYDCQTPYIESMHIDGNKLYVTADGVNSTGYRDNFCIYDISNPTNVTFLGDYENQGNAGSFTIKGNYAYILIFKSTYSTFDGIRILNISNPSNPTFVSEIALSVNDASGGDKVFANGSYLYVGKNGGEVAVLNIANSASPSISGQVDYRNTNTNWSTPSGLSLAYPILYTGNSSGLVGLNAVDVSSPTNPVLKGHADGGGQYSTVTDTYYIYGAGSNGLVIYEPRTLSRFCIDNINCKTSTTGRLGSNDTEVDRLNASASNTNIANWIATVGEHTITYCSDVEDSNYGLDGVKESNENDNCVSYAFTISPPPTNGTCSSSNGGTYTTAPSSNLCSNGTLSWTDSSGSDGTYNWNCTGLNGGSNASCSANFRPATPTGGTATAGTCGTANLNIDWADVSGATSYSVYYSNGTWVGNSTGSNYIFSGNPGQTYTFYVRANSAIGVQSDNSATFSGTVTNSCPPPASADITAGNCTIPAGNNTCSASVSWNTISLPSPSVRQNGTQFSTVGNDTTSRTYYFGVNTFTVFSDSTQYANDDGNANCDSLSAWDGSSCELIPVDPQINLVASRTQVRSEDTVTLSWTAFTPPADCYVTGPTGVNESNVTFPGNTTTGPITTKSVFVLSCGGGTYTDSVTVETVGEVQEI